MKWLLSFLFSAPLDRALGSVDKYFDNETEKEKAKLDLKAKWLEAQASQFNGKSSKAFAFVMVAFAAPLWFWYTAVLLYSVFWHRAGPWPQLWNIAALPAPLDQWSGWIMMTFFSGATAAFIFAGRK